MLWATRDADSQWYCGVNIKCDAGRLSLVIGQDHPSPRIAGPIFIKDAKSVSVVRCNPQRERSIVVGAGLGNVASLGRTKAEARNQKAIAAHARRQNQLALDRYFASH